MTSAAVARRIALVILVSCVVASVLLATTHNWSDAALVGLLGALALVTARMLTWRLRQGHDWQAGNS